MRKFSVSPGNIASVIFVVENPQRGVLPYFASAPAIRFCCVYLAPGDIVVEVEWKDTTLQEAPFPEALREVVRSHFAAVFALPHERRGPHLKTVQPAEYEYPDEPPPEDELSQPTAP